MLTLDLLALIGFMLDVRCAAAAANGGGGGGANGSAGAVGGERGMHCS
jgi:hypothetical protein